MNQQHKSQAKAATLEAKIAEQQLHIEVLAGNMFAQKQRADVLEAALQEAEQERIDQEQANEFVSGDIIERQQLLQEAANKPVRSFTQFDYFNENTGVCGGPDRDYDVFMGRTKEFNRSGCVRLLIPDNYSTQDARQALIQFLELVDDGQIENMRRPTRNAGDLFAGQESPFLRDMPGWVAEDIDDEIGSTEMHTPSGRIDYTPPVMGAFRARFFNRPLTPAEAKAIEAEMGRIELAAETENARFDALYEAVKPFVSGETYYDDYSKNLDGETRVNLRWWVQHGKYTGTTPEEIANEFDHAAAVAAAVEWQIDQELETVLRTTVQHEAPTISADVIFTEEGKPCVKLESSGGQAAWYGFSNTPNGEPRLVLLPDGVDDLPF